MISTKAWAKIVATLKRHGVELLPETEVHGVGVRWHLPRAQRPRNWYFPRVLCGKVRLKKRAPAYTAGANSFVSRRSRRRQGAAADAHGIQSHRLLLLLSGRLSAARRSAHREGESSGARFQQFAVCHDPRAAATALVDMQHMISTCGMIHSPGGHMTLFGNVQRSQCDKHQGHAAGLRL